MPLLLLQEWDCTSRDGSAKKNQNKSIRIILLLHNFFFEVTEFLWKL